MYPAALVQDSLITDASLGQTCHCLQVVEATVAAEKLVHKTHVDAEETAVAPIAGMAVLMPTFLNVMHGQDNWQGQHVSELYGDHSAWDVPDLVIMLNKFFRITKAFSMIDLEEEEERIDKVHSHPTVL